MKGMITCKVCGRDFPLMAEEHYVARGGEKKGFAAALGSQDEAKTYDAFDCPHCGCQNIVQTRYRDLCPRECITSEAEEDPKETPVHDGCLGCVYVDVPNCEEPCCECKGNYVDRYEKEAENE